MKLYLDLSISLILDMARKQVSYDFQAWRTRNAEVNAVYDDWAMTEGNLSDIDDLIEEFASDMKFALGAHNIDFVIGGNTLDVEINMGRDTQDGIPERNALNGYFKNRLLAWWYTYRDSDLMTLYETKANRKLEEIFDFCMPRIGVAAPRYF